MELREHIAAGLFFDGEERYLSLNQTKGIAERLSLSSREVEMEALRMGVCPERYRRNKGTLGLNGQLLLLQSCVGVVGCGGLGGYAIELLARSGVGKLVLIDGDSFAESNLNRQLFCSEALLGKSKAEIAEMRVHEVNSAVEVLAHPCFLTAENAKKLLSGCHLVIDALDSNFARHLLEAACKELGLPLVHGAIGGFFGQVALLRPGDPLFFRETNADKGEEIRTGTPPFTPALVAALEVCETIKFLTASPLASEKSLFWLDLERVGVQTIALN